MSANEVINDNPGITDHTDGLLNWFDIFYGIMVSPIKKFALLSNFEFCSPPFSLILGSMLTVIIAGLAASCISVTSFAADALILSAVLSVLSNLFFWLALALFLRLLAAVMRITTTLRSCFTVTGWSFMPLVFKAPAACFANATILGNILSLVITVWFLVLLLFAFDSLLKLGRLKTFAFIFLMPPCLYFFYFVTMIFVSKFIFDGFF